MGFSIAGAGFEPSANRSQANLSIAQNNVHYVHPISEKGLGLSIVSMLFTPKLHQHFLNQGLARPALSLEK